MGNHIGKREQSGDNFSKNPEDSVVEEQKTVSQEVEPAAVQESDDNEVFVSVPARLLFSSCMFVCLYHCASSTPDQLLDSPRRLWLDLSVHKTTLPTTLVDNFIHDYLPPLPSHLPHLEQQSKH
ncbi:Hypothetical predicted protein [Pelobates cultripes]|nr:Hypothetical predicted protein [Pelobates cultripes]